MERQNTALAFKREERRTIGGRLKPGAVMVGGVVVTDGRVITPGAEIKVVVQRIFQKQPVDLESKCVIFARFED